MHRNKYETFKKSLSSRSCEGHVQLLCCRRVDLGKGLREPRGDVIPNEGGALEDGLRPRCKEGLSEKSKEFNEIK